MVAERVPEQAWLDHELVVINPDGFQGDERDVILYSLSYDAELMPQEALSARMSDQAHIQGMLNVAFTRARDEIHVFHSAPIEAFTFAGGRPGAITDWLKSRREGQRRSPRPGRIEPRRARSSRSSRRTLLRRLQAAGAHRPAQLPGLRLAHRPRRRGRRLCTCASPSNVTAPAT